MVTDNQTVELVDLANNVKKIIQTAADIGSLKNLHKQKVENLMNVTDAEIKTGSEKRRDHGVKVKADQQAPKVKKNNFFEDDQDASEKVE